MQIVAFLSFQFYLGLIAVCLKSCKMLVQKMLVKSTNGVTPWDAQNKGMTFLLGKNVLIMLYNEQLR